MKEQPEESLLLWSRQILLQITTARTPLLFTLFTKKIVFLQGLASLPLLLYILTTVKNTLSFKKPCSKITSSVLYHFLFK